MAPTRASAKYSKKDGHLSISDDTKHVYWTPTATSPSVTSPTVTIAISEITNLQQTPATSKSIALKVLVGETSHVFTFTDKNHARAEQERVTETLRNVITAQKAQLTAPPVPLTAAATTPQTAHSAPSTARAAVSRPAKTTTDEGWYDDHRLQSDDKLQRSLLESNKTLSERFNQSLKDKPPTVSFLQITRQFWSSRLHLLRAHAIETAQKQGEYNVLPEIRFIHKPAEKEGEAGIKQLQMTKDQIKLIFKQYPVVLEAYNACCPPLSAGQFWEKFFASRLLKKLKGEKILDSDARDAVLDQYLDRPERSGPANLAGHVPHFLDLEGNEQNHSQKLGNRPDQDMRPNRLPILRVLNNLSEKMLSHVAPEDGQAHGPVGMDEETFDQLRLRDLAMDDVDNRVVLNVKEQQRYVGGDQDDLSAEAKLYAQQDPTRVLHSITADLQPSHLGADGKGALRLDRVLGFHDDREDEEDGNEQKIASPGSHTAMTTATTSILSSIRSRRLAATSDSTDLAGLTHSTFDTLTMTHNTTIEFLHYFWSLFLSGDSRKTEELEHLVSTLDRSLDRINAVGDVAEKEYMVKVDKFQAMVAEQERRTGKKRRFTDVDARVGGGGRKVVDRMVKPTVVALREATGKYRRVLEVQMKEAAAA